MTLNLKHILVLAFLAITFSVNAQTARFYTSSNGLPNSQINFIYQDHNGFIWIATENGLARFNGMDFANYRSDRNKENSLASNLVLTVLDDSNGTFWVGTAKGLQTFNSEYSNFELFNLGDPDRPESTQHISSIIEVPVEGGSEIWVGTSQHGVYVIDTKTHELNTAKRSAIDKRLFSDFVSRMYYSDGNVCIASETGGMTAVDAQTGEVKFSDSWTDTEDLVKDALATCFETTPEGDILVGTYNRGLLLYDKSANTISSLGVGEDLKIMSILKWKNLQGDPFYLLGTEDNGMKIYDAQSGRLRGAPFVDTQSDTGNWKIHSLINDNQGNLWVGAYDNGVMVIPQSMYGFDHLNLNFSSHTVPEISSVTSVLKDGANLWLGTDGTGLLDVTSDGNLKTWNKSNSGLTNNSVMSLAKDKRGSLWVATYQGGIFKMDGVSIRQFKDQNAVGSNKVVALLYDPETDELYAGTHGNGLVIIDAGSEMVKKVVSEDINKWVSDLYLDRSGILWVGTFNGPVYYNRAKERLINYGDGREDLSARVYSFCEDKNGGFWIGTGEGLISLNRETGAIKLYTEKDGLSSDVICSILEGGDGNIWIATSYGLSKLSPSSGKIVKYQDYDGLQDNEFHYRAAYKAADGQMIFGGRAGVTFFYPQLVEQKAHDVPPVYFTKLTVMNREVDVNDEGENRILDKHITEATIITLPHSARTFSLEFAVPEYTNPRKIVYAYKMDKYDPDWHYTNPLSRIATYTNIPSGRYHLTVKAYFDGNESEFSSRSIEIKIKRPWYLSFWAFLVYALMLAGLCYLAWRYYQKEQAHKKEAKDSEMKELRLQMFTNMSHEIRTPLSLVMTPLKKMREGENDPQKKELYNLMYRNCLRVNRIISQLMDMRKVDSGMMEFHFRETDIVYFIKDIMKSFEDSANTKKIDFVMNSASPVENLWVDQGNFDKIIFNILSNAFKYTPEDGRISVDISDPIKNDGVLDPNIKEYVKIDIFNSGSHIDEANPDKVFERFYQSKPSDANIGSGVGLYLSRMLAEKHHGKIEAANTDGGVTFSVFVPVGCDHLSQEEMSITAHHKDLYVKVGDNREDLTYTSNVKETKAVKSKKNLVLIDDDDEMRDYLAMELGGDYNVRTFASAKDAWSVISTELPDAVVTDMIMDGWSGLDLCRKVKENPSTNHIPVIILTSQGDDEAFKNSTESGADRFLTKPVALEILRATIDNVIATRVALRNKFGNVMEYDYSDIQLTSRNKELIDNVMKVIKEHLDDPEFSVENLSQEVGMSRVHLNRKMQELINQSPSKLIKSMRLKQAAYLLINNEVNISEVAYRVGFSTPSYFTNSFHDYYGMTPKEFVAKYLNCSNEETLRKIFS